jgi:hypothetical protein
LAVTRPDEHGERRRDDDYTPDGLPRRREDELEELLEHGSRNFRRYRRRAMTAFGIQAAATALALYIAVDNGREGRAAIAVAAARQSDDLADAGAEVAIRACLADNRLRLRLVLFVSELNPGLRERAAAAFAPRDCRLDAIALSRQANRRTP